MAERRMFAKSIVDSDVFLDMSAKSQLLYFHLSMRADDDGFVNNPNKIKKIVGCGDDETNELIKNQFIIPFDTGVIVIRHWRIHNYIQKDRYKGTTCVDEKSQLKLAENNAYILGNSQPVSNLDTECIQNVSSLDTQVRLGKNSEGKDSLVKCSVVDCQASTDDLSSILSQQSETYTSVTLTTQQHDDLVRKFGETITERYIAKVDEYQRSKGKTFNNNYETILEWIEQDKANGKLKGLSDGFNPDKYKCLINNI